MTFERVPDYVLTVSRERAGDFLLLFSRFEFAIKMSGHVKDGQFCPETDWNSFCLSIERSFNWSASPELEGAIAYICADPPKQPIFSPNRLVWETREPKKSWSRTRQLLFHVQGVRNNLAHGAKFVQPESTDRARDERLISAAITIINECLNANPGAWRAFDAEVGG